METKLRKLRILLILIVLITLIAASSGLVLAAEDIVYNTDNLYLLGLDFDYGGSTNKQTVAYAFWFDNSGDLHVAIAMQHNNGPASIALNDDSTTNYVLYPDDRNTLVIHSGNYGKHTAIAENVAPHPNSRWLVINFGQVSLEKLAETFKLKVTTTLGGGHYLGDTGTVYIVFLSYNVFYNANGGTGTQSDPDDYDAGDEVTVLNQGTMARTGFTFTGWNTVANGSGTDYDPDDTFNMPSSDVTLYAQWAANRYSVFYNANGGTGTLIDPNSPYLYDFLVTVLDPEDVGTIARAGYNFIGWNTAANGSGTDYDPDDTFNMPSSDVTLYAQWAANDYRVFYNANGGTGSQNDPLLYQVGSLVTVLNRGTIDRAGFNFTGWNTVANGSGTAYQPVATFSMPANNVTLYAQWTPREQYIPPTSPLIMVTKQVSVDGTEWHAADTAPGPSAVAGSPIRFKFTIKNVGNVALHDLNLYDNFFSLSGIEYPAFLNPGASFEYILTGITAAEGQHTNTVYATGTYGGKTYSDFDSAHYYGVKADAPDISLKKYVSVDKGLTWLDANSGPGPTADVGKEVRYKFVIVNSGNVPLTGLSLTDSKHTLVGLTLPASLASGATIEYILAGVEAMKGEQLNSATVSGVYNRVSYSDSDKAYYTGKEPVVPEPAKPAVTVKKYVSVNEGSTWLDADTAPGPSALIDNDVWFKFIMTNSGNVTLTDLTLTDSEYNLGNVGLPAKLDPGQSFEYIFKGVKAKAGEQINIAVALAKYGNETVTDTDRAIYTGFRKDKPTPPTTGGYLSLSAILGMLLISGGIFLKKKSKALNH